MDETHAHYPIDFSFGIHEWDKLDLNKSNRFDILNTKYSLSYISTGAARLSPNKFLAVPNHNI